MKTRIHSAYLIVLLASCLVAVSYFATEYYVRRSLNDFVTSWFAAEDVSLREGNILTSLSKSQRSIERSDTLKGIGAFDVADGKIAELSSFGEPLVFENIPTLSSDNSSERGVVRKGLFRYQIWQSTPQNKGVVIAFLFDPDYARYFFFVYNILLILLVGIFLELFRRTEVQMRESKLKAQSELFNLSQQVAHDIRSPLASLLAVVHSAEDLDENMRIQVRTAANRIKDIANNLLSKHRDSRIGYDEIADRVIQNGSTSERIKTETTLLSDVIDLAVSEKRTQFSNDHNVEILWECDPDASFSFGNIEVVEFNRAFSNLVNNAVEAFDHGGQVEIRLQRDGGWCVLSIKDNGKGIPSELLPKIGERGISYGKEDGNGFGVSHAKDAVSAWGGRFSIESKVGIGTQVKLEIPSVCSPEWFVNRLQLDNTNTVVVVDDDLSIHDVWEQRFSRLNETDQNKFKVNVVHLHSTKELLDWYRKNLPPSATYLCDFEFIDSDRNGLDLIEMLGIGDNSILVTSQWNEGVIRDRCVKSRIRILPKSLAGVIPLEIAG